MSQIEQPRPRESASNTPSRLRNRVNNLLKGQQDQDRNVEMLNESDSSLLFVEPGILEPVLEELQTLNEELSEDELLKAYGDDHGWDSNSQYNQSQLPEALTNHPKYKKLVQIASFLGVLVPSLVANEAYAQNLIPTPTRTPKPTAEIVVPTATMTPEAAPALKRAVVTAETLRVRKGPGTTFEVVTSLPQGTEVTLVSDDNENDGWGKIIYPDPVTNKEVSGEYYVSEEYLEVTGIITPTPTATEKPVTLIPTATPTPDKTPKPTATVRATETVTETGVVDREAVGGSNAENQALLDLAKEQLPNETIQTLSLAHQQPLVMDDRGYLVGLYNNGVWEKYVFPESVRPTNTAANLAEVQRILPEAAEATFNTGVVNIEDSNGNMIARVESGVVSPYIEESLLSFLKASPEFNQLPSQDSIIVIKTDGVIIAEDNGFHFIYLRNKWKLAPPDIEEQLTTATYVEEPLPDTLVVKENEVHATLREGYDLEGKVTLDENAGQVIVGLLADAFSKSAVLSPIMGSTQEEVINYLRAHNFELPAEFMIPSQLPPVVQGVVPYDRVKFISVSEAAPSLDIATNPVDLRELVVEAVWNDETAKYEDNIIEKYMIWTGNSAGQEGSAFWIDEQGIPHLTVVVKRREIFNEEPLRIPRTASMRFWMAVYMYQFFAGNPAAGGDEFAYQRSFALSNNVPDDAFLGDSEILKLAE